MARVPPIPVQVSVQVTEHPHATAVADYLENAGITPETLRYASTHEALCRHWIFDLLQGLATVLEEAENG